MFPKKPNQPAQDDKAQDEYVHLRESLANIKNANANIGKENFIMKDGEKLIFVFPRCAIQEKTGSRVIGNFLPIGNIIVQAIYAANQ